MCVACPSLPVMRYVFTCEVIYLITFFFIIISARLWLVNIFCVDAFACTSI